MPVKRLIPAILALIAFLAPVVAQVPQPMPTTQTDLLAAYGECRLLNEKYIKELQQEILRLQAALKAREAAKTPDTLPDSR